MSQRTLSWTPPFPDSGLTAELVEPVIERNFDERTAGAPVEDGLEEPAPDLGIETNHLYRLAHLHTF